VTVKGLGILRKVWVAAFARSLLVWNFVVRSRVM
jgi:hypothetical protein